MKKILSLVLSIVMLLSITAGVDLSAYADSYYEIESNETYQFANNIPLNSTIYGNCRDNSDYDWYKFTLSNAGKVNITFSFTAKDISSSWSVCVYKYNGGGKYSELDSRDIHLYDGTYKFPALGLSAGTYFIKVVSSSYFESAVDGVEYGVTVNYAKCSNWETEFNDEYSEADGLTIGTTMYGNCRDNSDYDWYKFTLSNAGKVNITFSFTAKDISSSWDVCVYRYNGGGKYSELDSRDIHLYDGTYKFPALGLSAGTYFIKVVSSSYFESAVDGVQYGVTVNYAVSKPSNLKVSKRNTTSLKLSWNKVSGVSGYQLQQYKSNKWTTVKNTTSNTYTVSKLKAGTTYKFRVRAYKKVSGKNYYSGWTYLTTPTKPATVTLSSVKSTKSKKITVKWKKATCTGYQVQYSTSSKFKKGNKTVTVSKSKTTSKTISKLKGKKKYYVRVRAYKTLDGKKYYGSWSKVKSVKVKK